MDIYYPKDNAVSHGKVRRAAAAKRTAWQGHRHACVAVRPRVLTLPSPSLPPSLPPPVGA